MWSYRALARLPAFARPDGRALRYKESGGLYCIMTINDVNQSKLYKPMIVLGVYN